MPRNVFISHSAQDRNVSEKICAALEQDGISCWIAPRDVRPGKSFPGEITRAIQQTKVMLLIFSRHSNSSEQVLREVQLAVDCASNSLMARANGGICFESGCEIASSQCGVLR